ncbi:hypothetical protein [Thalassospira povalilytica]|uniref:hypothetical protein n=1 Tax=Thalassospira povalilytica TaxID=732237 RepID=UPI003AA9B205
MRITRSIKSLFLLLLFFGSTTHANAEDQFAPIVLEHLTWFRFGTSNPVDVVIDDNVTDGCWTTTSATETSIKLELKRSEFLLSDTSEGFPIQLKVSATGYQLNEYTCVASIRLSVIPLIIETIQPKDFAIHAGMYSEIWAMSTLMSGPKSDMSKRIKDAFVEMTQRLILDIDEHTSSFEKQLSEIDGITPEEVDRRMNFIHLTTQPQ